MGPVTSYVRSINRCQLYLILTLIYSELGVQGITRQTLEEFDTGPSNWLWLSQKYLVGV